MFNLVAGTAYTTLKATAGTANGTQEDLEDAIFTALVNMGLLPGRRRGLVLAAKPSPFPLKEPRHASRQTA